MFEIADRLLAALDTTGRPIAVATAVSITGSAPRTVGTSMAYTGDVVIGSIAGGCVEGAVVGVCEDVLADAAARTVEYGVSDDTAYSVGLTCGGQLRIHVQLVEPQSDIANQLRAAQAGEAAGIASVVSDSIVVSDGGDPTEESDGRAIHNPNPAGHRFAHRVTAELETRILLGETALSTIECEGELLETFFEVSSAPARMIIFGAMEFSSALSQAAAVLGYRVTVCDPRSMFATAERFPTAEVVVEWPPHYLASAAVDERTVICVLSHDDRFDTELVALALASPAAYVGAMGSRRTSDRRFDELRALGIAEHDLARLRSPIGLDVGASTPEETAVSILAEILATRTAKSGVPLAATSGSIHRTTA